MTRQTYDRTLTSERTGNVNYYFNDFSTEARYKGKNRSVLEFPDVKLFSHRKFMLKFTQDFELDGRVVAKFLSVCYLHPSV